MNFHSYLLLWRHLFSSPRILMFKSNEYGIRGIRLHRVWDWIINELTFYFVFTPKIAFSAVSLPSPPQIFSILNWINKPPENQKNQCTCALSPVDKARASFRQSFRFGNRALRDRGHRLAGYLTPPSDATEQEEEAASERVFVHCDTNRWGSKFEA